MAIRKFLLSSQTWKEILIILCLSMVLGLVANFGLIKKFMAGEFRQAFISKEEFAGLVFISLQEAEDLWFNQQALFVDSRSEEEYGKGHIPGAVSVSLEEVNKGRKNLLEQLPSNRLLVIYCEGGDCLTSLNLGKLLYQKGFKNIRIFSGGWNEWVAAGKPVEKDVTK
jgi:rhodanese-related sulfurtransferase